jgi:hypothetical protein
MVPSRDAGDFWVEISVSDFGIRAGPLLPVADLGAVVGLVSKVVGVESVG